MNERKYYIDNVRIICILLLFPFHTAMMFNAFDEKFYLNIHPNMIASCFINCTYAWWMSGLFVLAGMSAMYALKAKGPSGYIKERIKKLLIPFISALLLLIPVQSYIADLFHNNYEGTYLDHFKEFAKITDFSGNDGHFTVGQTWFILYLFIISLACFPFISKYYKKENKLNTDKIKIWQLFILCFLPYLFEPILNLGGKSIGEFATWFLLGFLVFSSDSIQDKLEKYRYIFATLWITLGLTRCIVLVTITGPDLFWDLINGPFAICGIFSIIGLGKHFLNKRTNFTTYFAPAIYALYLFHQSLVIIIAYLTYEVIENALLLYLVIAVGSFIASLLLYELARRFPPTRFLFALKARPKF